ncbi:MAG: LuxR C-terminal-related transcriptional regulator [Actinomycetota bacterium]
MRQRTPVYVHASDPISRAGMAAQLRMCPEVWVLDDPGQDPQAVAVVVTEEVDDHALQVMRSLQRNGLRRIVVVVTKLDDAALLSAVEAGASGMLRRSEASCERLVAAVAAAASGEGSVPPDLLGRLLDQVGRLQRQVLAPRGLTFTGLTEREICVLKLVAEGHETSEIAQQLAFSERTIKNVIHDLTTRLNLRNRTHAVAYALKQGLI